MNNFTFKGFTPQGPVNQNPTTGGLSVGGTGTSIMGGQQSISSGLGVNPQQSKTTNFFGGGNTSTNQQIGGLGFPQGTSSTTGGTIGLSGTTGSGTTSTSKITGATGLFGNQPGGTGISSLSFSSNKPNTGGLTGGLTTGTSTGGLGLATGTSTGGLGLSAGNSTGGMTGFTTGLTSSGISFLGIPTHQTKQATTQNSKKEMDVWEIVNVIQNYLNVLSPQHPSNVCKYMLYNRVPKGFENEIQNRQIFPKVVKNSDGTDISIDYNLWVKALQNNPNRNLFYPEQISSPSQLVQRTKATEVLEYAALETILGLQNNLNQLNNLYDNDIENHIGSIKRKLQVIKTKQLFVISKMERLALLTGKADKNFSVENLLVNRLNQLKQVMTENNIYTSKIKELNSMTTLMGFDTLVYEEKDYLKDFDNNRLEKNMNILGDMKKIFDVTFNSLKQNMVTINFIKNDLENLKKYGKLPK